MKLEVEPIDVQMLLDALSSAASRLETVARFNWPRAMAKRADENAKALRGLRTKLMRQRAGQQECV